MRKYEMKCYDVSKEFYNLFFDDNKHLDIATYLNNSYCDEMGEIDLEKNVIEVFYHVENKYLLPPIKSGRFSDFYEYISNNIIHPKDKDIYHELMEPSNWFERLSKHTDKNFRFAHFRCKLQNGEYRWVEQVVLAGKENGIKDNCFRFYIFDIHNVKMREVGIESSDESEILFSGRNQVTGLYEHRSFEAVANKLIENNKKTNWCLINIDIEHFKLFDEWYGRSAGDYLLAKIGGLINEFTKKHGGVGGYYGQDDFVVITPYNSKSVSSLYSEIKTLTVKYGASAGFAPVFGVALLKETKGIEDAFDKASLANYRAKKDMKNKIHIYDSKLQAKNEDEYHILLDFMKALQNDEITFFLQPQCRISTKKIVGAEALARWIKKDGTIVSPGIFVPILEKFGFVADLDKHIWDKVCKWLKDRIDSGHKTVPISINISKVDIFTFDILEYLNSLVEKYQIPPRLLKVEITESAYAETGEAISELVKNLREHGFLVLMDDFGSGYSSLNMLRNIEVDVIKLDALFLNDIGSHEKGIHILESVINMTKVISLPIIVEGVETKEQTDFLENLGCRYVQGFYFYRGMPTNEFEALIENEDIVDDRGFVVKRNEQFKLREFLDVNVYNDGMLNNIIGAAAFYEYDGKIVNIVRFNQQFYIEVGVPDFSERLENIEQYMPFEDVSAIHDLLEEAKTNRLNGSSGLLRFYKTDGHLSWYLMRFYYLQEINGKDRYYGSVKEVTDIISLQNKLDLIIKYSSDTIIFVGKKDDKYVFSVPVHGLEEVTGINKEQLEAELNDRSIYKRVGKGFTTHMRKVLSANLEKKKSASFPFKLKDSEGKAVNLFLKSDPVNDKDSGVLVILTIRR